MESSAHEDAIQLRVNLSGRHKDPISDNHHHRVVEVEFSETAYIRIDDNAPAPIGSRSLATLSLEVPHLDFLEPSRFRDGLSRFLSVFEELSGESFLETLVPDTVSFAYRTGFREMRIGIEILVVKTTLCDGDACAICLDEIRVSSSMLEVMPCGHVFHQECSDRWLERSNKCPLCRETCFTGDPITDIGVKEV